MCRPSDQQRDKARAPLQAEMCTSAPPAHPQARIGCPRCRVRPTAPNTRPASRGGEGAPREQCKSSAAMPYPGPHATQRVSRAAHVAGGATPRGVCTCPHVPPSRSHRAPSPAASAEGCGLIHFGPRSRGESRGEGSQAVVDCPAPRPHMQSRRPLDRQRLRRQS